MINTPALQDAVFDRYDICDAYYQIEQDYHVSGILRERKSNQRRNEGTYEQLMSS